MLILPLDFNLIPPPLLPALLEFIEYLTQKLNVASLKCLVFQKCVALFFFFFQTAVVVYTTDSIVTLLIFFNPNLICRFLQWAALFLLRPIKSLLKNDLTQGGLELSVAVGRTRAVQNFSGAEGGRGSRSRSPIPLPARPRRQPRGERRR